MALLLAASALPAAGFVQEVLGLHDLSMACSVAAGAVLVVAVRWAGGPRGLASVRRPSG